MSLKVWLPLDGDLRNLGASDAIVTNSSATINTAGKIGSCYSFAKNAYLDINKETMIDFNNAVSICFWIKINSWNTNWDTIFQAGKGSTAWTQYHIGILRNSANYLCWTLGDGSTASNSNYRTGNITLGEWVHVTCVYGEGKWATYLNGTLSNSGTTTIIPNFSNITSIKIGGLAGAYKCDCLLNDFRIYDHCLSAAEIKEIARGLVLHYKLNQNFGLTDIIQNQDTYAIYNNYSGSGTTGTLTNLNETYQGHVVRRETMTPNDTSVANFKNALSSHGVCGHRQTFLANTKYVFWIYFRPISHMDMRVGGTASNISGWTEIPPKEMGNGWYRVGQYRNGTVTSDKTDNIFTSFRTPTAESGVPITIDWAAPHLLAGTTKIPDSDWFDDTEVIDSSGYNHNGEIINEITISSDTSRYTSSAKFNGSNAAIKVPDNKWMVQGAEAITINLWAKSSAWTGAHLFSCTESGGFNTEAGNSGYLRFPVHVYTNAEKTSTAYKYDSKEIEIASLSTTDWNMLTFVYDSTGTRTYINGELHHTYTNTSYGIHFNTGARLFLGCEASGASPSSPYFNGQISDFRIYCTPLLDKDIKLLYNIGMRVDNLGGIHAFGLEENQPNLMWRPENARAAGLGLNWGEGLGAYTQSNCQVTCDSNGYRIYRPPNLTVSSNGNTMYGGLKIRNSTNSGVHTYNASTDNIFGLIKNHTYIFIISVKGQSSNSASMGITNHMGWGGGGLSPSPSNVSANSLGTNFQGEKEIFYKFTITDDIVKTCTSAYSSFVKDSQYLSYMDFTFNFVYASTGTLGTDLYISNICLYDITNVNIKLNKDGILDISSLLENRNAAKIYQSGIIESTEFIEL